MSQTMMKMIPIYAFLGFAAVLGTSAAQADDVQATTPSGDRVILHPNGRWEYADAHKQEEAKKIAEKTPQNAKDGCPPGWQGGFMGFGRCVPPGDKDYNRGTLNPSKR